MAFFAKLKHALGFGDDYADEILCDTEESPAELPPSPTPVYTPQANDFTAAGNGSGADFSEAMRRRIFDHVVEVFNGSMPTFIRDSVDPHAQSDYIYRTLDESIKEYMTAFEERATMQCRQRFSQKENELNAEISRLQSQSKKIDDDRSAIKERQLSADRQKRALTERVHELEQQVASLDAEREQLQLETQSLLNKLKVAQIQGSDTELQQRIDTLQTENAGLQDAVKKQADMQMISETMMGDLRQSASKAREEANEAAGRCEVLQQELQQLQSRHEATSSRLKEAEELIREAAALHQQLEDTETKLHRRDERVKVLKQENKKLQSELEQLQAQQQTATTATADAATVDEAPAPYTAVEPPSPAPVPTPTPAQAGVQAQAEIPAEPEPLDAGVPRISDEALNSIEINFGEENWTTDSQQSARPETKPARQGRRKHNPADDMQLSLF